MTTSADVSTYHDAAPVWREFSKETELRWASWTLRIPGHDNLQLVRVPGEGSDKPVGWNLHVMEGGHHRRIGTLSLDHTLEEAQAWALATYRCSV